MEYLAEAVLEVLFSLVRGNPAAMPDITYKEQFTVHYNKKKIGREALFSLFFILIFSVLAILFRQDEICILYVIFVAIGVILFGLTAYLASFSCSVTPKELLIRRLFRKKSIPWSEVAYVKRVYHSDDGSEILVLYRADGRCLIDFTSDIDQVWYVLKMAEQKALEIREAWNLSIREIYKDETGRS